jgi:hypothetical protein
MILVDCRLTRLFMALPCRPPIDGRCRHAFWCGGRIKGLARYIRKANTVGGSPTASHFLLLRQKKVTQEKATPVRRRFAVPCVARLVRRLRNSRYALRQSSPTSPDQPALLGGAQGIEKPKTVLCARCARLFVLSEAGIAPPRWFWGLRFCFFHPLCAASKGYKQAEV